MDSIVKAFQGQSVAAPTRDLKMHEAALKLEATFLAEMLKSTGLGDTPTSFGGGAGEENFASFLREAQAMEMAKAGGIGLAQTLFEAMKGADHDG